MANWLNLPVMGHAIWPIEDTTISFSGCEIHIKPASRDTEQSLHVDLSKHSEIDAHTAINRFLSVLSWCDKVPVRVMWERGGWSGSQEPVAIPRDSSRTIGSCICKQYPFFRSLEQNSKAQLALALFREALNSISIPGKFLGFFKILNTKWNDRNIVNGIQDMLKRLTDEDALARVKALEAKSIDIPSYLYKEGRCAIAHAFQDPLVDPDDWDDSFRIASDIPLIRALAVLIIG